MHKYFLVFLFTIVIVVLALFRSKIISALSAYKKDETRVKVARTLLTINLWVSIPLAIVFTVLLMGHGSSGDDVALLFVFLGFLGFLSLLAYLTQVSFANQNIFSQIYIWGFCAFIIIIGIPLFPFSTIFGVFIALGQIAWKKLQKNK